MFIQINTTSDRPQGVLRGERYSQVQRCYSPAGLRRQGWRLGEFAGLELHPCDFLKQQSNHWPLPTHRQQHHTGQTLLQHRNQREGHHLPFHTGAAAVGNVAAKSLCAYYSFLRRLPGNHCPTPQHGKGRRHTEKTAEEMNFWKPNAREAPMSGHPVELKQT